MPTEYVLGGATEQVRDVGTDLAHLEVGFTQHRQDTSLLNTAGDVDRLPRAVVEVDGRADRHEILAGHLIGSFGSADRQRAGLQMIGG